MIVESILNLLKTILDTILFFELPNFPTNIDNVFANNGDLIQSIYKAKFIISYFIDLPFLSLALTLFLSTIVIYYSFRIGLFIYHLIRG